MTTDQTASTQPRPQRFYCEGCQQWHEVESLLEAVRAEAEKIRLEKERSSNAENAETS